MTTTDSNNPDFVQTPDFGRRAATEALPGALSGRFWLIERARDNVTAAVEQSERQKQVAQGFPNVAELFMRRDPGAPGPDEVEGNRAA